MAHKKPSSPALVDVRDNDVAGNSAAGNNNDAGNNESGDRESGDRESGYQVVARRYRPQSFAELVGQSVVSTALSNAILRNRVGHAYLFTGARGTGKTSTARIFAKCLNCVSGPTVSPCQTCDNCLGITAGDDIDVLEIDGASNRRIEEIRQLRSTVSIRPSRARYKIYIIDEVHMLTREAFNALLKTLEEPPPHVKFMFCTTEPEKIPITIRSRCQQFDFVPVEETAICERLRSIAQAEQVEIADEALRLLARRAAGSMRDSQSLLEQILSTGRRQISLDDAQLLLGIANHDQLEQVAARIESSDAAGAVAAAHTALRSGVDPAQLASQLLDYFRDCLLAAVGCDPAQWSAVGSTALQRIRQLADGFGIERLLAIAQVLDDTLTKMRQSAHPQILVEIALVRICHLENLRAVSELIERLSQTSAGAATTPRPPSARPAPATSSVPSQAGPASTRPPLPSAPPTPTDPAKKKELVSVPAVHGSSDNPTAATPAAAIPLTRDNLESIWQTVLHRMNDTTADMVAQYHSLELRDENQLVVTLPEHLRKLCARPDRLQRIGDVLRGVTGQVCSIDFVAGSGDHAPTPPKPTLSRMQQRRDLERHPLIQRAVDLFAGEVVEARQGKAK